MYQATILFLFNQYSALSIRAIQERTAIGSDLLLSVVLSLIQTKIIKCSNIVDDQSIHILNESDLQLDYEIRLSST